MSASAAFFSNYDGPARDSSGSPLIVPRGGLPGVRVPYTRASSLSGFIERKDHIYDWESAYLVKAMAQNPDLAVLASTETYNTGFGRLDQKENRASKRRLLDIKRRALDRAGIHLKADWGTAFHAATEPGAGPTFYGPLQADVQSFFAAMQRHSITPIATECFVACDQLRVAGTFDHLVRVAGQEGCFILDKKSGRESPHEWAVQFSAYAHSEFYNCDTDERMPMPADLRTDRAIAALTPVDPDPAVNERNGQSTQLFWVDIEKGWAAAQLAAAVRDWQADTNILEPLR